MVKPSDLQVAMLLEEIACAMRVDTPIVATMHRLETRRLGRIGDAAKAISSGLLRGESVADAVESIDSPTSDQAAAAIRACEKSGDPGLIELIADQLRQRSAYASDSRLGWFYPWLLLAVGYVVAVLVMAPMIRQLNGRDFHWSNWLVGLADWLEFNWWLPPAAVAIVLFVFIGWLYSRARFPRAVRLGLFCNTLADQFTHDVPEDVAIGAAAEMSGDRGLMAIGTPTLKSPEVARILSKSNPAMGEVIGVNQKQLLIARLRYLGSIHTERARLRSYVWSRFVPRCAMVAVGGGLTLSYAWWVIAPVYSQVAQW